MGLIQEYAWGTIEWLTDQTRSTSDAVDLGITTIFPKHAQQKHIHYGDEQWLYILSGCGRSVINQVESELAPGDAIHIPAGAVHETQNTGEVPLVEILISYPKQPEELQISRAEGFRSAENLIDVSEQTLMALSEADLKTIRAYGEALTLPITVYNTQGTVLFSWERFPKVCRDLCGIEHDLNSCHIYDHQHFYSSPAYSEQSAHYCKYGLAVLDTPIVLKNQMVGNIRGGHILTEDNADQLHPQLKAVMMNLENVPKGRLRIILNQYKKLADHLAQTHLQEILSRADQTGAADPSASHIRMLKEDLDLALGRILNLQINHHFLFNTLNAIAGLALEENSFKTYRSIIDLSKLFRYSLRTNQEFVAIKEETDYIRHYAALQEIRFGQRLQFHYQIPEDAQRYYIPFNTLQPLVENAFVHGFRNREGEMALALTIENLPQALSVSVRDNGQGMLEEDRQLLLKRLEESGTPRRGLSMVIDRLRLFFGDDFSYRIATVPEEYFEIVLTIPKRTLKASLPGGLI